MAEVGLRLLGKIAQTLQRSGPVLLVLRKPRGQCSGDDLCFGPVDLFSAPASRVHKARGPQSHQVLGNARGDQLWKLGCELTHCPIAAFYQDVQNATPRGIREHPKERIDAVRRDHR